jgi:hypothetical protein
MIPDRRPDHTTLSRLQERSGDTAALAATGASGQGPSGRIQAEQSCNDVIVALNRPQSSLAEPQPRTVNGAGDIQCP